MLNREQKLMLFKARRTPNCLFSTLPVELIREISEFGRDDTAFNEALHHVAYGELEKVQAMLEEASRAQDKTKLKELLLLSGTAMTPAVTVKHTTLLECALGSGDPEMIEMIKSYFSKFEGGEEEKERQLERYRPCIKAMENQKPDDLTWLFDIIKKASAQDVLEELKTGDQYDPSYKSALRDAMNKFRKEKLDPKVRTITKPRMHCNYQNLNAAYELLNAEWNNLKDANSYDKHYLVARQIIGLIGLIELPAYERYVFARGQAKEATAGKKIERSLDYKYDSGTFPLASISLINSHSGVGFDFFVSICGAQLSGRAGPNPDDEVRHLLQGLCQAKNNKLAELMQAAQRPEPKKRPRA
ncbi:MAG: hypothetical protein A3F42_02195 [Gammaproteobacteria bacterium RIFCSPHIGHO2_12_FULL_37_34]|nr:MAG: hypothetical protein A3F42_02195 [Gammaproteobacteria bacterium RIFCSPHIGHO2_12_FULL_37_34]